MTRNNIYEFFHLIPSNGFGGVENAAKNFDYYRNSKFEFKVVFINNNYLKDKGKILKNIKNVFINNLKFIASLKRKKKVIIISSLWRSCLLSLLIKFSKKDIRLILFLHSTKNTHFLDNFSTSLYLFFANEVWGDSAVTINTRLSSLIIKRKNIKKKVISFVLKKNNSLPNNKLSASFIYWGRINNKEKNLSGALKFFKRFSYSYNDAKLIIIGKDDGFKSQLENKINEYRIKENVEIHDFMDFESIKKYANKCSFFLQLSFFEGFAISVVEAMQLGLVPVVTDVGEIRSYCIDNFNSVIYKSDLETFNDVSKLLNNKEHYLKIRKNAIEKWVNKKTYEENIIYSCESFLNNY